MRSEEMEERFRTMLQSAGVDLENPSLDDVERTWAVYRRFAAEPVDDAESPEADGDGILAQYGVYSGVFSLDMTRQLSFNVDGDYDHMTQMCCTFEFEVTDALAAVGAKSLWSFDLTLDEFFEQALALPGFVAVRAAGLRPTSLRIEDGEV